MYCFQCIYSIQFLYFYFLTHFIHILFNFHNKKKLKKYVAEFREGKSSTIENQWVTGTPAEKKHKKNPKKNN